MYPEDIEELFPMVKVGTPVYLVNEPVKIAWAEGQLLLEAHPPIDAQGQTTEPDLTVFEGLLETALGESVVAINWDRARTALQGARGMPVLVGLEAESGETVVPAPEAPPEAAGEPVATGATAPAAASQ